MMITRKYILVLLAGFLLFPLAQVQAQEEDFYEDLLREEVKVENPVYKPVIGFGTGLLGFHGEVRNHHQNFLMGRPAFKVNVSTFIDNKRYYKANFFLINGTLGGNERSFLDPSRNLNFQTEIVSFGVNAHYSFGHFMKEKYITPFISIGIESVVFNSKSDLQDSEGNTYHYWSDGTIRNIDESQRFIQESRLLSRNYKYETDLRGQAGGTYNQYALAIPIDLGLDFKVTDRMTMRLGTSLHYTFTDYIDNVHPSTSNRGNKWNDMFSFSYLTMHLDLFSSPKTITIERLFADIEFDYTMYGDSDNDMVFDGWDECPDTPLGVPVDSVGCPFDTDGDGIPDYLDKEPNTRPGALVDDQGVEINEENLAARLNAASAIRRSEVEAYLLLRAAQSRYTGKSRLAIPTKFKSVDADGDGYISFEEVLQAIDDFFDFKGNFTTGDIHELNNFFFAQ